MIEFNSTHNSATTSVAEAHFSKYEKDSLLRFFHNKTEMHLHTAVSISQTDLASRFKPQRQTL